MAIGIVNESEFDSELNSYINGKISPPEIKQIERGRGTGTKEVPESLRKIIGENALEEGSKTTEILSNYIGVSPSSVSAYKNGATSTKSYDTKDKDLNNFLKQAIARVQFKAVKNVENTLDELDGRDLSEVKPRDLAGIAKDMSAIVKNMEPESDKREQINGPSIIIYAPRMSSEDKFDVVVDRDIKAEYQVD